jgi:outer membrane protein TolC
MIKQLLSLLLMFNTLHIFCQDTVMVISLKQAVSIAQDSSLTAFKNKYTYETDYYSFRDYKLGLLPILKLSLSPFTYNQAIARQWNSTNKSYEYYEERYLNNSATLNLQQIIEPTGGKIYLQTDLNRLENYTSGNSLLYSSTPFKIGLSQPLFAFNSYKWEKRIEPVKFELAKLEYIQSSEKTAYETTGLYFGLLIADQNLKIAENKLSNADTLYQIGQKRIEILAINQADLLTLKLDKLNAENDLRKSQQEYKNALKKLGSYLKINPDIRLKTIIPDSLPLSLIKELEAITIAKKNNPFYLSYKQQLLESERDMEKTKAESKISSNLDLSFGYNQRSSELQKAYQNLLNQQKIDISIQIPIVDWGQKRNTYRLAKSKYKLQINNLEQTEKDFEQDAFEIITEFNYQKEIIFVSKESADVAVQVYELNKKRFLLGQIDVNTLSNFQSRKENALKEYINTLQIYWQLFYKIRQLTLFNFETNTTLIKNLDDE